MASLEAGRRLADRYVLQQRLGDGGHAEVWAADDDAGQRVALKFLHLRSCSVEEAWQVLGHEAQMARRLAHPAVLKVGEPQRDGLLVFLPIEYASGGDASPLRGAPWQQVLPILLQVAEVLEHAHSRGVVHRDIKPGNVLFDAQGRVRLTDFGTAARTGCSDALSAGSPFSASPAQLRDEPASTSDDVYGLGALAYELLSRYPPYFPSFDTARVQAENPPRLAPVHDAPPELLDCIMSMLARDASERPDLQQVMQVFGHLLQALPAGGEPGTVVIEASADSATPVAAARSWMASAPLWLAAAAVAAIAAFLLLPKAPEVAVTTVAAAAPRQPVAVADAVVTRETGATQSATVAATPAAERLSDALQAGHGALAAGQAAQARAAFQRALIVDADNAAAKQGLSEAAALDLRLADLAVANQSELRGDLVAARTQYRALLAGRSDFAPAREALLRVEGLQHANELEAALTAGAEALRRGQLEAAQSAYARAASLSAEEPRVLGGLARVAEVQRSRRNTRDLETGVALEQKERWSDAIAHYQSVAARDGSLLFAQDGLARSTRRDALDRELQDYLDRPERLTAAGVRNAAERAMARGEATSPHAPRLDAQLTTLRGLLQSLASQVRVAISSDNNTQISVARVGDLGAFRLRELALPPGHYTVVGRREGFRDVRLELQIAPGQPAAELSVQCTERI